MTSAKEKPMPAFMSNIRTHASRLVSVVASTETYRHDNMTRTRCPECGKFLLEVNERKNAHLSGPECGYRGGVAQLQCPLP